MVEFMSTKLDNNILNTSVKLPETPLNVHKCTNNCMVSTEAQRSGAGHTHTLLLAFHPLRRQNSKFSGTWGQILDLLLLLLSTGNKDK